MAAHNEFGRLAEQLAARLLERNGWTILHRNWRWRHKEIDLIVRRDDIVAFVEVKARRDIVRGHPLDAIGGRKRHDLELAAIAWMRDHARPADAFRFDAVFVLRDRGRHSVQHVEGAWMT